MVYFFRDDVRAYMKYNEILYQILYIYIYIECGYNVVQVKASKFNEK